MALKNTIKRKLGRIDSRYNFLLVRKFSATLVEKIFVDSVFWYKFWHCHRLPSRSFRVNNRQFHICARCTGLASGIFILPLAFLLKDLSLLTLILLSLTTFIDGFTQLLLKRESNNSLRFITGFAFPPSALAILLKTISL